MGHPGSPDGLQRDAAGSTGSNFLSQVWRGEPVPGLLQMVQGCRWAFIEKISP